MPQLNARPQSATSVVRSKESISGKLWACAPCFSSDGSTVYCACSSAIKAISVTTGEQLFRLLGHTDEVTALALHPNGAEGGLLSGSKDCTVRQWDVRNDSDSSSKRCLRVFRLSQPILSMLLQPHLPQSEGTTAAAGDALYLLTQWAADSQPPALEAPPADDELSSDAAPQAAADVSSEAPQTVKRKRKRNRAAASTDADNAVAATAAADDPASAAPAEPVAESVGSSSKRRRRSKADKTPAADSVAAPVDDDSTAKPNPGNGKARSSEAPVATANSSPEQDTKAVRRSARAAKAAAAAAADSDAETDAAVAAVAAADVEEVEAATAAAAESLPTTKKERAKLAAAARKVAKKSEMKRMRRAKKTADRPDSTAAAASATADSTDADTDIEAAVAAVTAEPAAVESAGLSSKQLRKLRTAADAAASAAAAAAAAAAQSTSQHHWQVLELALPTAGTLSSSDAPAVTRRIAAVARAPLALAVALAAQGRRWVVQAKDKQLVITDAATGEQWGGAAGRKLKRITAACCHVGSGVVATGHANGSITLWYGLAAAAEAALARRAAGRSAAASDDVEGLVKTRTLHWHAHAVQCISFRYTLQLLYCILVL
jgi:trimeric autotransporter adhesin